jgi:hypothetical protein
MSAKREPFMMLFRRGNRKKSTHRTPQKWRPQVPDQGSTVGGLLSISPPDVHNRIKETKNTPCPINIHSAMQLISRRLW